jgi:hypothetical protein
MLVLREGSVADLYVDMGSLRNTRRTLSRIAELLDAPCRELKNVPIESAGHAQLRSRLESFSSDWGHGIGKLGEFSEGVSEALQNVEDTFTEVDQELATALTEAGEA